MNAIYIDSKKFSWRWGRGSAFASCLPGDLSSGFNVTSHRTGVTKHFEHESSQFDGEGDLLYEVYSSGQIKIIVWND
jgi:hypothetical protein